MFDRLKALAQDGLLMLEIQGLRADLAALINAVERIATTLELQHAQATPPPVAPTPDVPAFDLQYVEDAHQAELMDIELRLTTARGMPPTDEEVLQEWELRHTGGSGGREA